MAYWKTILLGKPRHPYFPDLREIKEDMLYFESLTRGTLISGNPGTGKTTWTAMILLDYTEMYPNRPIVVLDSSESLINEFITLTYLLPSERRDSILRRFVLDRPGDTEWVMTKPFFSQEYGYSDEDQVQRAVNILEELDPERLARNPTMTAAIKHTGPQIFRLLQAIKNEYGQSLQITDAKPLLYDTYPDSILASLVKQFGSLVPTAKDYFEKRLLREKLPPTTRSALVDSLLDALQVIEPNPLRARYGYPSTAITMQEVIDKGLIYLVSGAELNNQKKAQGFVFWEVFTDLKYCINKRVPHDPNDVSVLLIIDEAYQPFKIQGMAEEIGQTPAYYRSRKLLVFIIIQAFWQLDDLLKQQVWNFGNLITFSLDNHRDAYEWVQQAIKYNPTSEKLPAVTDNAQPMIESDRGQYLAAANWIQRLGWRQMVMRRYLNEREKEPFVAFVNKTREKPTGTLPAPLPELKAELLRKRAIPIREALDVINRRKLISRKEEPKERPTVSSD